MPPLAGGEPARPRVGAVVVQRRGRPPGGRGGPGRGARLGRRRAPLRPGRAGPRRARPVQRGHPVRRGRGARLAARPDRRRPDLGGRVPGRGPRGRADGDPHRVRRPRHQPVHHPVAADRGRTRQLLLLHRLRGAHRRRAGGRGDDGPAPGLRRGPLPRQLPALRRGSDPGPPRHVGRGVRRGGGVAGPTALRPALIPRWRRGQP